MKRPNTVMKIAFEIPAEFNPLAKTPEEHWGNVLFQMANVSGWLSCGPAARDSARAKSGCLLEATEKLVGAFEAENGGHL